MDRLLISLKFTMLRHSSLGLRGIGWVLGALFVVATWTAAVLAAPEARHDVLTLAFALWAAGAALGPVLLSGRSVLQPGYFALLPLRSAEVGRGLLMSVFVSIASGFVLLAFAAALVPAFLGGPGAVLVALVGAPLTWVLAITASRLVFGLLGAAMRSKVGVEIAAIQFGLMFAGMFTGWMIVQVVVESVPRLLTVGIPAPALTAVLDALPTSWVVLAVEAAASGDLLGALAPLGALVLLDGVLLAITIPLLAPRPTAAARSRRARPRSVGWVAGGGLLPATPTGAVIAKELRQWWRDPWRALELRTGVWTGLTIGLIALISGTYSPLSAFAGLIVAFMLGLSACNLYGQDGSAVWQTIVGENDGSVRADVRGRQWAAVLLFLPQALLLSAIFVALSGQWWTIPVLAAALPATIGAASGAAILTSAVGVSPGVDPRLRVGPNDANGNIGLHVWVVILLITIGVAPTGAAIAATVIWPSTASVVLAVIVGVLNGVGAAWFLGSLAIGYLQGRMPDVYSRIRYARIFREKSEGILGSIENATLLGEQKLAEQKKKEREERIKAAAR